MVQIELKEGFVLTIGGRLDSGAAPEAEAQIDGLLQNREETDLVVDADKLEYISSAGLRVILKLRKKYPKMSVINVSSDVYDIFEMTGFTEMINVEKAYRQLSVEGCEVIGKGAKGTVYRLNQDTIVKVYNDANSLPGIKKERELARRAFVLGIPTAISYDVVKVGESFGSVFELLDAQTLSEKIASNPDNLDEHAQIFTTLLKQIHSTEAQKGEMYDMKEVVLGWLETAKVKLKDEEYSRIKELISNVPDYNTVLHCDYHSNNVMMQNNEAILIDMDTLSQGHPVFELANIFVTYVAFGYINHPMVENFMGFSYSISVKFWEKIMCLYFGVDDYSSLEEVENKIELLGYLRLLRHMVRRGLTDDESMNTIKICQDNISSLVKKVEKLDF